MARVLGVDIPNNKKIPYALTYIHGIGLPNAKKIVALAKIDPEKRTSELTDHEFASIRQIVADLKMPLEGDVRREQSMAIKRLMEMGCYRGLRHRRNLPVRGQRTKTNARTRKGPRKTIANKKVETK